MKNQSILQLSQQLSSRKITAESLVRFYLDRIEKLDSYYKAYEFIDKNGALEQARASDALRAKGVDLGVLMGIPVAIKDLLHVDGMPTTVGSRLDVSSAFEQVEGEFIKRLRDAGCIFMGKTKTAEFALSSSGINYINGTPINPYSTDIPLVPGGSSSGSAVATAANLCAFSVGTDTGGSVRTPAAYCGLVGIKFGSGAMDSRGAFPLSTTLDSYGIFTHDVESARLITEALGLCTTPQPTSKLKLGVLTHFKKLSLDEGVRKCWDAALEKLAQSGHTLEEVSIESWHPDLDKIYATISRAEAYATVHPCLSASNEKLVNPEILKKVQSGSEVDALTYISALRKRSELIRIADKLFDQYDALITPTKPTTPPTYPLSYAGAEEDNLVLSKTGVLTREINTLYMSGASLPIHQLGSTLPVGLQLMCRAEELDKLIQNASILEQSVGLAVGPADPLTQQS